MKKKLAINIFTKNFLGTEDKVIINELDSISKIITLDKKENLFMEGNPATNIYYIISGSIKLYRISNEGKEIIIRVATKQDIFAEAAIASLDKYPVNATSTEKTELLAISVDKIRKLTSKKPEFLMQLLGAMTCQLKYLINVVSSLNSDNVEDRLIKYLNTLSEKNKSNVFILPIQKGDLALLLGTTAENLSRLFKKLTNKNLIKIENKTITLLN